MTEKITDKQLADKLQDYYRKQNAAKVLTDEAKLLHVELMQIAVSLGADQLSMIGGGAKYFLDGYLVAHGVIPQYRVTSEPAK